MCAVPPLLPSIDRDARPQAAHWFDALRGSSPPPSPEDSSPARQVWPPLGDPTLVMAERTAPAEFAFGGPEPRAQAPPAPVPPPQAQGHSLEARVAQIQAAAAVSVAAFKDQQAVQVGAGVWYCALQSYVRSEVNGRGQFSVGWGTGSGLIFFDASE